MAVTNVYIQETPDIMFKMALISMFSETDINVSNLHR